MSNDQDNLYKLRHSAEHVFAQAVKELYGDKVQLAVAHISDSGFANDAKWDVKLSEEDFAKIEKKMQEIIDADLPIVRKEIDREEAKKMFATNPFKLEWIDQFDAQEKTLTVYWTGDKYVDFCKGPHVKSTGEIKAFKLLSVGGAYWRGDEKNEMLVRVYGTAFESKKELENHLDFLEKAKERDHRKLNETLDIFAFSDLVGKGLVMFTPNGTIIKNLLRDHLLDICKKFGAMEVNIPHMAKIDLYEKSGHAKKFRDELFFVKGHYDNEFVLKPVNCPHHTQIYASRQRSYRDLPIAYVESTQQHRDEKPGSMGGLNRTSSFEVDDGHTFCRPDQIKSEAINIIKIIEEFYKSFGMWGNHWVSLSFKDPAQPDKYIGEEDDWKTAQSMLSEINEELKLNGQVKIGEAALYGPKIDFMLKDALGNDRQLGTVQIDFAMPKNFGLEYVDKDGQKKTPVMLHRAILGSYQRFIAYLMESTLGAFPVWLSPLQVVILPISSDKHADYAFNIAKELKLQGIRVEVDDANETLGNKIRKAQAMKTPYMVVVGDKEIEKGSISVRLRGGESAGEMSVEELSERIKTKIAQKSMDL